MPLWRRKADPILHAHFSRLAEMDLHFQAKMREVNRRFPLFVTSRMEGSSGFRMATVLRYYFIEYLNRIYKVGLTRRRAESRARELGTATGVPLPFEVLASWEVADCGWVEKEVHRRLKKYRLNKNREFFRAGLSTIVAAVEQTIADRQ